MGGLTPGLAIAGLGAVTAAGLTAPQTLAAIRAGISGFTTEVLAEPFGATQTVAKVPANWRLKKDAGTWLANMAARALEEALGGQRGVPVLLAGPEAFRLHPAVDSWPQGGLIPSVEAALGFELGAGSSEVVGGAAGLVQSLDLVAQMIGEGRAEAVILVGVDSYVNPRDLQRLMAAERLAGPANAQGLIPGEGAVAMRFEAAGGASGTAAVWTCGGAEEADAVLGSKQSQGRAMQAALEAATPDAFPESCVDFVVSTMNGERYAGLEALVYRARFFRTYRKFMATAFPASSVGDIGAASGLLAMAVAADSVAQAYAPGEVAMCEVASEDGGRAAALVR